MRIVQIPRVQDGTDTEIEKHLHPLLLYVHYDALVPGCFLELVGDSSIVDHLCSNGALEPRRFLMAVQSSFKHGMDASRSFEMSSHLLPKQTHGTFNSSCGRLPGPPCSADGNRKHWVDLQRSKLQTALKELLFNLPILNMFCPGRVYLPPTPNFVLQDKLGSGGHSPSPTFWPGPFLFGEKAPS
jgi:hypothetical protein